MHHNGTGTPRNYRAAVLLWHSAGHGPIGAQYNLGVIYADSKGVAKDNVVAYM